MTLPEFKIYRPKTLVEAIELLSLHGDRIKIVAGGTDLVINMKNRLLAPRFVLDIRGIDELRGISFDQERGLRIGALTTIREISESEIIKDKYRVLHEAASVVAGPNLRNMGTLGGNLCLDTRCVYYNQSYFWRKANDFCLKKDGAVCHVAPGGKKCWAAYSGDTAPALIALGATVRLISSRGERAMPLKDFFVYDGIEKFVIKPDEILVDVTVPASMAGYIGSYGKLRIRQSIDYPIAGAAVVVKTDTDGVIQDARVAITAVNPAPLQVGGIDALLVGKKLDDNLIEQAAELAKKTAKPLKTSGSTMSYRRHMIGVFVKRGLAAAKV